MDHARQELWALVVQYADDSNSHKSVANVSLDPEERERLEGLRRSWHALVGVHHARESHRALAAHLVGLKNRRQGHTVPLSSPEVSRTIAAAAQGLAPLGVPLHGGAY